MTHILIVGGEKGGVGKSMVARCLIEYLQSKVVDSDKNVIAIDSDREVRDIVKIYNSKEIGFSEDARRILEPNQILQIARREQPDYIVVNLPGNTYKSLYDWLLNNNFSRKAPPGEPQFVYLFVTDGCYASIDLFSKSIKELGKDLPHFLVRNEGRLMSSPDWSYLERKKEYKSIPEELFTVADFPLVPTPVLYEIDSTKLTFQQVLKLDLKEIEKLKSEPEDAERYDSLLELYDLKGYVRRLVESYTQTFDKIFDELPELIEGKKPKSKVKTPVQETNLEGAIAS